MVGFEIDSSSPQITLPVEKVAGGRILFDQLEEKIGSRALEVAALHQIRGHIEQIRASNACWKFLTGPNDLLLQYTNERATRANFPAPEVWGSFRNSLSIVFNLMQSESKWRKIYQGSLLRLLTAGQRLPIRLGRISPRFMPDRFVWASVGATLEVLWSREFPRTPTNDAIPHFRSPAGGDSLIGECERLAANMAIASWAAEGTRNIALRTDRKDVLSWAERARPHSPAPNRILKTLNLFCLRCEVDVCPSYVRSDRDIFADGLTRWSHTDLDEWVPREGMAQVDAASRLWAGMALSCNPDMDVDPPLTLSLSFATSYIFPGRIITGCVSGDGVTLQRRAC